MKISHLTSVVQSLAANSRSNAPVLVVDSEDDAFPLKTMEELDKLERQLSEKAMMQKMVKIINICRFNSCSEVNNVYYIPGFTEGLRLVPD